jgi:hypothetical protein
LPVVTSQNWTTLLVLAETNAVPSGVKAKSQGE